MSACGQKRTFAYQGRVSSSAPGLAGRLRSHFGHSAIGLPPAFFWSTLRPRDVPAGRRSDDLSVPGHDVAALYGRDRPAPKALALERREVGKAVEIFGPHLSLQVKVHHHEVCVRADGDRSLPWIDAVHLGWRPAGPVHQKLETEVVQVPKVEESGD